MAHDPVPGSGEPRPDEGRIILREWPAWLILAALWAGSLLAEPHLPARVPIHWGFHGEVNGWSTPWEAAWQLPALATGMYGFILLMDWGGLDFRAARRMAPGTKRQMRLLVLALMAGVQAVILGSALRGSTPGDGLLLAILSLFLVLLGNLMPRLEPNAWIGIRIPPTLENREVWKRPHRMTGRWLVLAGLLGLPLSLVPWTSLHVVLLALILVPLGAGICYAYVLRHRMAAGGILPTEAR